MEAVLKKWINKRPISSGDREQNILWSNQNISGNIAAKYFESIILYSNEVLQEKPVAPWLKNTTKS